MGDPATAAAAAAIAGMALEAGGKIVGAQGQAAGQKFEAERAERSAEMGRIKADQTDAQMHESLNTTLANITAIRAAANTDPTSPTGIAIMDEEERIADRARTIRTTSLRMQASEDEATALMRRRSAKTALLGGYLGAASSVASAFGKMGGKGGSSGGGGPSYDSGYNST